MITIVTPAESQLLSTLDAAKSRVEVCDSSEDILLNRLIQEASDYISRQCNRVFGLETIKETVKGYGMTELMLSRTPIVSVVSVLQGTQPIVDFSIEDSSAGFLYRALGWQWTAQIGYGLNPSYRPSSEESLFEVNYDAGYVLPSFALGTRDLPYDLESLVLDYIQFSYRKYKEVDPTLSSIKEGDISTQKSKDSPFFVDFNRKLKNWTREV